MLVLPVLEASQIVQLVPIATGFWPTVPVLPVALPTDIILFPTISALLVLIPTVTIVLVPINVTHAAVAIS